MSNVTFLIESPGFLGFDYAGIVGKDLSFFPISSDDETPVNSHEVLRIRNGHHGGDPFPVVVLSFLTVGCPTLF